MQSILFPPKRIVGLKRGPGSHVQVGGRIVVRVQEQVAERGLRGPGQIELRQAVGSGRVAGQAGLPERILPKRVPHIAEPGPLPERAPVVERERVVLKQELHTAEPEPLPPIVARLEQELAEPEPREQIVERLERELHAAEPARREPTVACFERERVVELPEPLPVWGPIVGRLERERVAVQQ